MEKKTEEGNRTNSRTQLVIVFLVGFLLGLLVGPTFAGDRGDQQTLDGDTSIEDIIGAENATSPDGSKVLPSNSSVVADNQLAGDRVVLSSISLEKEGWVVVHESQDGVPVNALGAQRFDAGVHIEGHVDLLRNTEVGNIYFVILYDESGDGEFNLKEDAPLVGKDNGLISTTFETIQVDRKN